MNQLFRKHILESVKNIVHQEHTEISLSEDETILSVIFHKIGEFDGTILTQMNFMSQYNKEDAETVQFFSVLAADVKEEAFEAIETRLNELNLNCMFGHFVLHRELKQIFFRYTMPLKTDDEAYSLQSIAFVWEEIYGIMTYFLAYVLLISNEPDYMSLKEYMEDMSENA